MCKPVSKTFFFDPQENEKKDVSATGVYSPRPHGLRVVWHAFFFFFTLQTFAIDEDGPCHPTVRISKPKRHLLYVR